MEEMEIKITLRGRLMHEIYNAIYSVDLYLYLCIYLFIENKLTRISSVLDTIFWDEKTESLRIQIE